MEIEEVQEPTASVDNGGLNVMGFVAVASAVFAGILYLAFSSEPTDSGGEVDAMIYVDAAAVFLGLAGISFALARIGRRMPTWLKVIFAVLSGLATMFTLLVFLFVASFDKSYVF